MNIFGIPIYLFKEPFNYYTSLHNILLKRVPTGGSRGKIKFIIIFHWGPQYI